jgi:hypothetical protein
MQLSNHALAGNRQKAEKKQPKKRGERSDGRF